MADEPDEEAGPTISMLSSTGKDRCRQLSHLHPAWARGNSGGTGARSPSYSHGYLRFEMRRSIKPSKGGVVLDGPG
ncbi:BQ5605_C005g03199 [Microbotryum silenes-dioicae]|uniref:BQ5605_C005g03199 protein n=1 Tax=Microbotryum silenes-dioicae TaxID=796604 RepID=A0A2X0ME51_9BASI|nr:BQ5605_C005g03199 [Microbotryum silenes-dioicae]